MEDQWYGNMHRILLLSLEFSSYVLKVILERVAHTICIVCPDVDVEARSVKDVGALGVACDVLEVDAVASDDETDVRTEIIGNSYREVLDQRVKDRRGIHPFQGSVRQHPSVIDPFKRVARIIGDDDSKGRLCRRVGAEILHRRCQVMISVVNDTKDTCVSTNPSSPILCFISLKISFHLNHTPQSIQK